MTTADDHETGEDDIDNFIEINNGIIDMRDESFNFYHDSECESDSDIYLSAISNYRSLIVLF